MSEQQRQGLQFQVAELDDGATITITGDKALARLIANAAQRILAQEGAKNECEDDCGRHVHFVDCGAMHHAHSFDLGLCLAQRHGRHGHRASAHVCCCG